MKYLLIGSVIVLCGCSAIKHKDDSGVWFVDNDQHHYEFDVFNAEIEWEYRF